MVGACVCDAGFATDVNGACVPNCGVNGCNEHGLCSVSNGVASCACDAGYDGAPCLTCAMGFQDDDGNGSCAPDCTGRMCSGHGACAIEMGAAQCFCDVGYEGTECDACTTGFQDDDDNGTCKPDCSSLACVNGMCGIQDGTASCACTTGHIGALCDTCDTGYQDSDENRVCLPDCTSSTCGIHGTCALAQGATKCTCETEYAGSACQQCATGFQDADGNGSCLADCSAVSCGSHGMCAISQGSAGCVCDAGYSGAACNTCAQGFQDNNNDGTCSATCATANLTCPANGACSDGNGTAACVCNPGYAGASCTTCVRYVKPGATGTGDGKTWANAFTSINAAILAANTAVTASSAFTSCEVWVAEGTFNTYSSSDADTINLASNVWLFGGFAGTETDRAQRNLNAHTTYISGRSADGVNDSYRTFRANNVRNVVIDGFDITGGNANAGFPNDRGPAVFSQGSTITLENLTIHDTIAGAEGGGVASQGDISFTIRNSSITRGQAGQRGGGIYLTNTTTAVVDNVTITNNRSVLGGGGILFYGAASTTFTLSNSTITDNISTGSGGAVQFTTGALTATGNTIKRNIGADGGGFALGSVGMASTISNTWFESNSAGNGGAIVVDGTGSGAIALKNVVMVGNLAGSGGAVARTAGTNPVSLVSCTLWANRSRNRTQNAFLTSTGSAFSVVNSIIYGHHVFGGNDYSPAIPPVLSYSVIDDATLGVGTNKQGNPALTAVPNFTDITTAAGTTTTIIVGNGAAYTVGFTIVIAGVGARTVTATSGNTITVSPALPSASTSNMFISSWSQNPATTTLDLEPLATSSAVDAADGASAPVLDLLGNARVDEPTVTNTGAGSPAYADIGAIERIP